METNNNIVPKTIFQLFQELQQTDPPYVKSFKNALDQLQQTVELVKQTNEKRMQSMDEALAPLAAKNEEVKMKMEKMLAGTRYICSPQFRKDALNRQYLYSSPILRFRPYED